METRCAYRSCLRQARHHYENFPVASWTLPARLRGPVAAIYVFARRADDMADEGEQAASRRLAMLDAFETEFDRTVAGRPPSDPLWIALDDTIRRHALPPDPFRDLLSAFRQDAVCNRHETFDDVLAYCRRSANPVGRLLLHLHGATGRHTLADADAVCTALQLINFLQDLEQDFVGRDRLYIPQQDLARHGVDEALLRTGEAHPAVAALLAEQVERAAWWLYRGSGLPRRLRGRFAAEIRMIIRGGWAIVVRLREEKPARPFARPRLRTREALWIAGGLLGRRALPASIRPPAEPAAAQRRGHQSR